MNARTCSSVDAPLNGALRERKMQEIGEARMELTGAGYFYTLAQVGITFAGFAALLMTVREMRGAGMSKFHLWVARSYVQSGMFTAVNAMLSPLLFGLGFSERMTW
jgi:hypothetical protein